MQSSFGRSHKRFAHRFCRVAVNTRGNQQNGQIIILNQIVNVCFVTNVNGKEFKQ